MSRLEGPPDANPYRAPGSELLAPGWREPRPVLSSPWRTIWTRSRGTVRRQIDLGRVRSDLAPPVLLGLVDGLTPEVRSSSAELLIVRPLGGLAWALLIAGVGSTSATVAGRVLGGSGTFREVAAAVGWATVPALKHLGIVLLVCVAMALEGNPKVVLRPLVVFGLLPIAIAAPVFWAWSGVVLVLGVAEAHRFSAGRGLASAGLARLVLWGLLAAAALVGIRPF